MIQNNLKQIVPKKQRFWPLWKQLLVAMLCAMLLATIAADWFQRRLSTNHMKEMVAEMNQQAVSLLGAVAIEALIVEDGPVLETIVSQTVASLPHIHAVTVWNEDNLKLAKWMSGNKVAAAHLLSFRDEFVFEGESFGSLEAVWDLSEQYIEMEAYVGQTRALVSGIVFILTMAILAIVHWLVVRHINRINERVLALAEGDLTTTISLSASQELVHLAESVNSLSSVLQINEQREEEISTHRDYLEERVALRTRELNREIEERKQAMVALREAKTSVEKASQAKSEFLANMSHELRTPMHAILSFADMGMEKFETAPREKLYRYYSRIHESGDRLLSLLNALLDLSKLEAGRMEFNWQENDIRQVVGIAVSELSELAEQKSLNLKLKERELDTVACFDQDKLLQVVRNLLANAIKFTAEGKEITISFNKTRLPAGPQNADTVPALSVTVSDQGVGIPEHELKQVFDKFVQSSKTKSGAGGTGLGLAICKEIIEGHHGYIQAANNPQGGAAFTFTIPYQMKG